MADGILKTKKHRFTPKRREGTMKNRIHRKNPESDDSEEKLRGKIREIAKQLEAEKRYSRALEKRLKRQYDAPVPAPEPDEPAIVCGSCGKEGTVKEQEIYTPNGPVYWMVCQLCHHKEKKK